MFSSCKDYSNDENNYCYQQPHRQIAIAVLFTRENAFICYALCKRGSRYDKYK